MLGESVVLVLDPGHGGDNGGCIGHDESQREKAVTLMLARELADALKRRIPQARVVLTREDDRTLPLAERMALANEAGATLFVSLHANASPGHDQQGFETYVLDAASARLDAARAAARELSAAEAIAAELASLQTHAASLRLARSIQASQRRSFPERFDRGVKAAPFDVLMQASMPAVLFEAGFLDHPEDARVFHEPSARARVVDGLVEGVVAFLRGSHQAGLVLANRPDPNHDRDN